MNKDEFAEVMRTLKMIYPSESFTPKEWFDMYQKFPADVVKAGIRAWNREGQWGHKAPTPRDLRDVFLDEEGRSVGSYDPEGDFEKALIKLRDTILQTAKEANEEIRNG